MPQNKKHINLIIILLLGGFSWLHAQKTIELTNGSFEGEPHDAINPEGWESCGYNSTPDILPGPWGVYQKPTDGYTFLGLISRENNTWETIEQKLVKPLKKGQCYKFTVDLSRSPAYAGYAKPVRFRVWASTNSCERMQMIALSPTVEHNEWRTYPFMFFAEEGYKYIIIECFYKEDTVIPYRGNILIDNFTNFEPCDRA